MSADTARAAMPGVEEIARLVADVMSRDNHALALHTARKIKALFAPILAEKERWNRLRAEDIMTLGKQLGEAWKALEPFDDALGEDDDGYPDDTKLTLSWQAHTDYSLTLGDLRRARAAAIRAQSLHSQSSGTPCM